MGLEMADALQGQTDPFVPSRPGLFFPADSAEVIFGVPHGIPAAGRGRAGEYDNTAAHQSLLGNMVCGCRKDKSGGSSQVVKSRASTPEMKTSLK